MRFEFATAGRIVFGDGTRCEVASASRALGSAALVVVSAAGRDRAASMIESINPSRTAVVHGEPTVEELREIVGVGDGCGHVIAIGGGSVIDAGKAIAALITNPGDPLDYMEVVGRGMPLANPPVPLIAVPTTAGAGAEVTRNAVIKSGAHRVKASIRSSHLLPRVAVVDPELTHGLPPATTASTGLDALTQLIEPYVSVRANAMTDQFCVEGMRAAAWALRRAFRSGGDREARARCHGRACLAEWL